MKNLNYIVRIISVCLTISALLCACAQSPGAPEQTDPPNTVGQAQTGEPSATESELEPVTEPATEPVTEPVTEPDPAAQLEEKIMGIIKTMTVPEKIGQLFLVRCSAETAAEDVRDYHLGGYVLFAADFENRTPAEAADAVASYQTAAKIPLIIAADEEGGSVVRVSKYAQYRPEPFKSSAELYNSGGLDAVLADIDEKAALLRSVGVNCNLAPICDVSVDPSNYIYPRTLGRGAALTADYVSASVKRYAADGMGCVLKHFPGYGGNADTHKGLSVDTRDYKAFENGDLLPFKAGIAAGAGAVMVSHNIVNCIDPDYPSSLSAKVHALLRETLGFEGVIMTDSLDMGAIKEFGAERGESAAVLAVSAGNDIICTSDFKQAYSEITAAVASGAITEARLDESVARILRWKIALGLISAAG